MFIGLHNVRIRHLLYLVLYLAAFTIKCEAESGRQVVHSSNILHSPETIRELLRMDQQNFSHTDYVGRRSRETVVRLRNLCSDRWLLVQHADARSSHESSTSENSNSPQNRFDLHRARVLARGHRYDSRAVRLQNLHDTSQLVKQELWMRTELKDSDIERIETSNSLHRGEKLVEFHSLHTTYNGAFLCLKKNGRIFLRYKQESLPNEFVGSNYNITTDRTNNAAIKAADKRSYLGYDRYHGRNCVFAERLLGCTSKPPTAACFIGLRLAYHKRRKHGISFCGTGRGAHIPSRPRKPAVLDSLDQRHRLRHQRCSLKNTVHCRTINMTLQNGARRHISVNGDWFDLQPAYLQYFWLHSCGQRGVTVLCRDIRQMLRRSPQVLRMPQSRLAFSVNSLSNRSQRLLTQLEQAGILNLSSGGKRHPYTIRPNALNISQMLLVWQATM